MILKPQKLIVYVYLLKNFNLVNIFNSEKPVVIPSGLFR